MAGKAQKYIDSLTANGEISFTAERFCRELKIIHSAGLSALRRLKKKKEIVSPSKGYYLILTPEFRNQGCLPADYFIDDLMHHLNKSYYVSLLSAALYYGAAHQQPQIFQIMVRNKKEDIRCGNIYVEFIKNIHCDKIPIRQIKTRTGYMKISTPEATAMDMLKYMRQCGGINRIATVIEELAESMSEKALNKLVIQSDGYAWVYRLGFLLDKFGHSKLATALYKNLDKNPTDIIPLVPYASRRGAARDKKWRIAINAKVESDLDDTH